MPPVSIRHCWGDLVWFKQPHLGATRWAWPVRVLAEGPSGPFTFVHVAGLALPVLVSAWAPNIDQVVALFMCEASTWAECNLALGPMRTGVIRPLSLSNSLGLTLKRG